MDIHNHKILLDISTYYGKKIRTFGPCPEGVDWNGLESQYIRFEQLVKVVKNINEYFTINDLGCGYGAFLRYMLRDKLPCSSYIGYDISSEMIECARNLGGNEKITFPYQFVNDGHLLPADYTVASGIFNVRNKIDDHSWLCYIKNILHEIHHNSEKGFSFNMLTCYSDKHLMKKYLYYADPCVIFDFCKVSFSKNVALVHDYNLHEFTIIVRK